DGPQRAQLGKLGAEILEYVPDDTYLCRYPPNDLAPIRALPFVAWANVYMQNFKIAAALRATPGSPTAPGTARLLALPPIDTLSKDRVTVDVVLHKNVDVGAVRAQIAAAAGLDPKALEVGRSKIRVTVERRQLSNLAAIDEVRNIEPYVRPQLFNNVARGI